MLEDARDRCDAGDFAKFDARCKITGFGFFQSHLGVRARILLDILEKGESVVKKRI
ncbi:MAG: hypothetical protein WCY21_01165 [Candidatus Cloacimonadaceae bacterium]|jgi:hypothetical protein|nr:hypothetical protein [Candidatus Cloacimonadota bacterium]MDX9948942.1 hypothetical protein [Candidatus Syntrophosphaera sp.]NLN85889.1 hypothetical protein [Candidatus Cloacimonadota bacterium]